MANRYLPNFNTYITFPIEIGIGIAIAFGIEKSGVIIVDTDSYPDSNVQSEMINNSGSCGQATG